MRLGRRLSAGIAHDPPAPATPAEPTGLDAETVGPDQRAAEIVAAAAHRVLGELTPER